MSPVHSTQTLVGDQAGVRKVEKEEEAEEA